MGTGSQKKSLETITVGGASRRSEDGMNPAARRARERLAQLGLYSTPT